jgi:hypothetical protein
MVCLKIVKILLGLENKLKTANSKILKLKKEKEERKLFPL